MTSDDERLFLTYVQRNPINRQILQLAPALGVSDWWLTAGALFQTVWNVLDGRDPGSGIRDYDLF
ncbi:nucleotidyltransferase family protein [Arthrobacter sp. NPDC093128]|uniref:nucleotidyltransferase family protein n=1 Tax=Arthrobacter sp. NPDC093128 TaxID=3154979 RepID=UPI003441963C